MFKGNVAHNVLGCGPTNERAGAASKAAVATLTIPLAEEVAGKNILVNAVAPSTFDLLAMTGSEKRKQH